MNLPQFDNVALSGGGGGGEGGGYFWRRWKRFTNCSLENCRLAFIIGAFFSRRRFGRGRLLSSLIIICILINFFFLLAVEEFLREAKEKFEEQWKNQSQVNCFLLVVQLITVN